MDKLIRGFAVTMLGVSLLAALVFEVGAYSLAFYALVRLFMGGL